MDASVRRLLEDADDAEGWEVPHDGWDTFPYKDRIAEIVSIQDRIRTDFALEMKRDGNVQDASFIDELSILEEVPDKQNTYFTRLSIRFSNFGKLFTIYSCLDPIPSEYPMADMIALVESFGWNYVSADALDEQYDGANISIRKQGCSWWIRFFDYL